MFFVSDQRRKIVCLPKSLHFKNRITVRYVTVDTVSCSLLRSHLRTSYREEKKTCLRWIDGGSNRKYKLKNDMYLVQSCWCVPLTYIFIFNDISFNNWNILPSGSKMCIATWKHHTVTQVRQWCEHVWTFDKWKYVFLLKFWFHALSTLSYFIALNALMKHGQSAQWLISIISNVMLTDWYMRLL